jgi:hypothetical protein
MNLNMGTSSVIMALSSEGGTAYAGNKCVGILNIE